MRTVTETRAAGPGPQDKHSGRRGLGAEQGRPGRGPPWGAAWGEKEESRVGRV